MHSAHGRSGQTAMSVDHGDLVLLHQEIKPLGMLDRDVVLTLHQVGPVQLRRIHAIDAVAARMLQMIPDLS